jgi:hypothetical protein
MCPLSFGWPTLSPFPVSSDANKSPERLLLHSKQQMASPSGFVIFNQSDTGIFNLALSVSYMYIRSFGIVFTCHMSEIVEIFGINFAPFQLTENVKNRMKNQKKRT